MANYKRKHYFFTASLGLVVIFLALSVLSPILFADEKKDSPITKKVISKKNSLNSVQQKIVDKEADKVLSEARKPASIPKKNKKAKRLAKKFPGFLKKRNGDYLWQPNVYAVPKRKSPKSVGKVLGHFDKFSIVDSRGTPSGSFPIIWSKKHKKYGVYRGKIVILTEQSGVEAFLKKRGHRFSNLSGSFIVKIESLDDAFSLVQNIQSHFPQTLVDIDIDMN